MKTVTFPVRGMTCASCVNHVEKALKGVAGVQDATVNLAMEEARVSYDGVSEEALSRAVSAAGYALVTEGAVETPVDDPLIELRLRMTLAVVLAAPLLVDMLPWLPFHLSPWLQLGLSMAVVFYAGRGIFAGAFAQAAQGRTSLDTLVALGAFTAWAFGLAEWVWPAQPLDPGLARHLSFETAAGLVAFLLVGRYLEAKARTRAAESLRGLLRLAPPTATWLPPAEIGGGEKEVPVGDLNIGDLVRVKPGMAIPADGTVVEGYAEIQTTLFNGEPLPVPKGPGDPVIAGTLVHGTPITVRVEATGRNTFLSRMASVVAQAQASRPPLQDLADKVSAVFVPTILVLALLTLAGWWFTKGSFAEAWRPAVTVLVVACPCALGLATPLAMSMALGTAARRGMVVKDLASFEALGRLTDLAFDKTGTITKGQPVVQQVQVLGDMSEEDILAIAGALEQDSVHPIARGIRNAAPRHSRSEVYEFKTQAGGLSGKVRGRHYRLGSVDFLGIETPPLREGTTVVGLAEDEKLQGLIHLADERRPDVLLVLRALENDDLTLHLWSGDREEPVKATAEAMSLKGWKSGCSPEGKSEALKALKAEGKVVGFVGDGVNDAMVLAKSDCGIAVKGAETARSAAGLHLVRDGFEPILIARRLSRRTALVIRESLLRS
ncbi:MAG: cation-translocating P-type ATPase [Holophagaceae bacterium]|nr:cation-translocating P-type ATPase [Holophagaceae bacterium]